ncbi:MAG: CoA-binding protein [Proteobacteria bacterium]|nr:CoA-binding protein [Pseudomonadota bacterium]
MTHPLDDLMRTADGFVVIGNSAQERFPGMSYASYVALGKRFFALDLGGLTEARGPAAGGKVYPTPESLPRDELGELAIVWVKPKQAAEAVQIAHDLGLTKIWFSFQTATADAIDLAAQLGLEVVEVGRCPVYYAGGGHIGCRMHTLAARVSGLIGKPPNFEADKDRRELL